MLSIYPFHSDGMIRHINNLYEKENEMTPLRKKMIDDMKLAGLAPRTQKVYIKVV